MIRVAGYVFRVAGYASYGLRGYRCELRVTSYAVEIRQSEIKSLCLLFSVICHLTSVTCALTLDGMRHKIFIA